MNGYVMIQWEALVVRLMASLIGAAKHQAIEKECGAEQ